MIVPIYLVDKEQQKQNDLLGLDKEARGKTVDFVFKDSMFSGYWIDNEDDDDDIIFYVAGATYATPFSVNTVSKFESLIIDK